MQTKQARLYTKALRQLRYLRANIGRPDAMSALYAMPVGALGGGAYGLTQGDGVADRLGNAAKYGLYGAGITGAIGGGSSLLSTLFERGARRVALPSIVRRRNLPIMRHIYDRVGKKKLLTVPRDAGLSAKLQSAAHTATVVPNVAVGVPGRLGHAVVNYLRGKPLPL